VGSRAAVRIPPSSHLSFEPMPSRSAVPVSNIRVVRFQDDDCRGFGQERVLDAKATAEQARSFRPAQRGTTAGRGKVKFLEQSAAARLTPRSAVPIFEGRWVERMLTNDFRARLFVNPTATNS